jgi:hypothetical protein
MSTQAFHHKEDHMDIGRYQTWLEDGKLKLYYHEVGKPTGISCSFNPEETRGLLELLSRNKGDIEEFLALNERKGVRERL